MKTEQGYEKGGSQDIAYQHGRADERARIVAWLQAPLLAKKTRLGDADIPLAAILMNELASRIEQQV